MRRAEFFVGAAALAAPCVPLNALAESRRVALVIEHDDSTLPGDAERFQARLGGGLIRARYTLVARDRLNAVLQEQGFSNSQFADPTTAAALGKIVGASHILWGKLTVDQEEDAGAFVKKTTIDASADFELIRVVSATIITSGTAEGSDEGEVPQGGVQTGLPAIRRNAIDACVDDLLSQVQQ